MLIEICKAAKAASAQLAAIGGGDRNRALAAMADALMDNTDAIITANKLDLDNAKPGPKIDRLMLNKERVAALAQGIREVAALPDPLGITLSGSVRPNGLAISKVTVPLGVIGTIYESRPNVTSDISALCIKSGNAVILRGGSEAINTNKCVVEVLQKSVEDILPPNSIQIIPDTSRETVAEFMRQREYVDLLIPRGGAGLIKSVTEGSNIPTIETGTGICHTYVDSSADLATAKNIAINAKISRPSVCNSMETLLVHTDVADEFLPIIIEELQKLDVEIRGDEKVCSYPNTIPATDEDYRTEYNDLILAVKVVETLDEAIAHINAYSSKHSECIVATHIPTAERFLNAIDAACVYLNASTRFSDGGEFGLGAEIGISTQKLHARGPMGIEALCSYKYIIRGSGQIR